MNCIETGVNTMDDSERRGSELQLGRYAVPDSSDEEMLDWLDQQAGLSKKGWVCRPPINGGGFNIYMSDQKDALATIRDAISDFIIKTKGKDDGQ